MGSDTFTLPQTAAQDVRRFQKEYLEMSRAGDRGTPHACFRSGNVLSLCCCRCNVLHLLQRYVLCSCSFVWALVHSPDPAHLDRGLELAQSMINSRDIDQQHLNDLVYMCAVVSVSTWKFCICIGQKAAYLNCAGLFNSSFPLHRLSIAEGATKLQKSRSLSI